MSFNYETLYCQDCGQPCNISALDETDDTSSQITYVSACCWAVIADEEATPFKQSYLKSRWERLHHDYAC